MRVKYEAADGKLFGNRYECIEYEDKLFEGITAYDDDEDSVELFDPSGYEAAVEVRVFENADIASFWKAAIRLDMDAYCSITHPGRWYWNGMRFVEKE